MGLGPITVVGWSTGGIIALCLALRHPQLVRNLVLQEPPLYARTDYSLDVLRGFIPVFALSKLGMKTRAAEHFNRFTYGSGGTGYDQWPQLWKDTTRRNAKAICDELDLPTGEGVVDPEHLCTIQQPALGLLGELSHPYYRRAMDRIARSLTQLRVQEIPRANHAMHLDGTSAWVQAITDEVPGAIG